MPSKRANTLDQDAVQKALDHVRNGSDPERDTCILLLSFKAGLRAKEIAGLRWSDITDANGDISGENLFVPADIAKGKKERTVPMNPKLYMALVLLRSKRPQDERVIYGGKRCKIGMSANSLCVWMHRLYEDLGLHGCSSHSGRRTFITNLARNAGKFDCSIRDVQVLAGHKSLTTTEKYIDISPNVDKLVRSI